MMIKSSGVVNPYNTINTNLDASYHLRYNSLGHLKHEPDMQIFHDNIRTLDQFTHDLNVHRDKIPCPHCKTGKYLRGHGFVYKRCFYSKPWPSGKRIICSNRDNNLGCGRTRQLYVKHAIPQKHYHTRHLVIFIFHLIRGLTVDQAYFNIRQPGETRNGYRWVQQLQLQLTHWRSNSALTEPITAVKSTSPTAASFLSTLSFFAHKWSTIFVSKLQYQLQRAFLCH